MQNVNKTLAIRYIGVNIRHMDSLKSLADQIQYGELDTPHILDNGSLLLALRITGTGVTMRGDRPYLRSKKQYLSSEFLDQCSVPILLDHPPEEVDFCITPESYNDLIVGHIKQAYIKGDEVWAIAHILGKKGIEAVQNHERPSTSPMVQTADFELDCGGVLEDFREIDHVALTPLGQWDKQKKPEGINYGREPVELTDEILSKIGDLIDQRIAAAMEKYTSPAVEAKNDQDVDQAVDQAGAEESEIVDAEKQDMAGEEKPDMKMADQVPEEKSDQAEEEKPDMEEKADMVASTAAPKTDACKADSAATQRRVQQRLAPAPRNLVEEISVEEMNEIDRASGLSKQISSRTGVSYLLPTNVYKADDYKCRLIEHCSDYLSSDSAQWFRGLPKASRTTHIIDKLLGEITSKADSVYLEKVNKKGNCEVHAIRDVDAEGRHIIKLPNLLDAMAQKQRLQYEIQ